MSGNEVEDAVFRDVAFDVDAAGRHVLAALRRHGYPPSRPCLVLEDALVLAFEQAGYRAVQDGRELRIADLWRHAKWIGDEEDLWAELCQWTARPCYIVWHGDASTCWRFVLAPPNAMLVQDAGDEAKRRLPAHLQVLRDLLDTLPPDSDHRGRLADFVEGLAWAVE